MNETKNLIPFDLELGQELMTMLSKSEDIPNVVSDEPTVEPVVKTKVTKTKKRK